MEFLPGRAKWGISRRLIRRALLYALIVLPCLSLARLERRAAVLDGKDPVFELVPPEMLDQLERRRNFLNRTGRRDAGGKALKLLERTNPVAANQAGELQQLRDGTAAEQPLSVEAQEVINRPNIDWQEQIHRGNLRGLRKIFETP
jgi:hypothetical protein